MQLIGAIVADYKSVRHAEVPLDGLTVLFGPNGAGKTNLIEALGAHDPLARAELSRSGGQEGSSRARVGLVTRFAASADGTGPDADLLLEMLAAPWAAEMPASEISDGVGAYCGSTWWLEGGDLYDATSRSDLAAAYGIIRSALLADVPDHLDGPARRFLDLLLDEPLLLVQEDFAVELTCDRRTAKGAALMALADELVSIEGGVLVHVLGVLRAWTGRWPPLTLMSRGPGAESADLHDRIVPAGFEWLSGRLGGVHVVSGDVDTVEQHLDDALELAHDELLHRPDSLVEEDPAEDLFCTRCLHDDHGGRVDSGDLPFPYMGSADWLEEQPSGWIRVRPSLLAALQVIEGQTNERLPSFVAEQGRVRLEVRPVPEWDTAPARCRIMFDVDPGKVTEEPADWYGRIGVLGHSVPADRVVRRVALVDLGAGMRRWVATSVRLAADACAAGEVAVLLAEDTGQESEGVDPSNIQAVAPTDLVRPRILLVDEPEQHLHPHAQHAVARWAVTQSRQHHAVVVATHSPAFVALPPDQATVCQVKRVGHETRVHPLRGVHGLEAVERARDLGFELGLGRDALAQLTRAVAVVEGEWDRRLLYHFYGAELADQRVLVVPLQGSNELQALADAAVIPALGVPVIALLDDVRAASPTELAAMEGTLSKAERGLRDLAADLGDSLRIVRYPEPDVICALPENAVRLAFPSARFPGWAVLLSEWAAETAAGRTDHPFKRWALGSMGLSKRDRLPAQFFRAVLERADGLDPGPSFQHAAKQLLGEAAREGN